MRKYAVAALAIVTLFTAIRLQTAYGDGKEKATAKDLQAFEGTWKLSSREVDGRKFTDEEIKDNIATNDGFGKFSVRRGGKEIVAGITKLDPSTQPKSMDVILTEGEHKGKTLLGIYEIDGDSFRVCHARPGDKRPTEFSADPGSGRTLIVYKREK